MAGEINNREYRKGRLQDIIGKLHAGHTVEQVKDEFAEVFGQVSAEEISNAEQALIDEGMPVEEVQRLCDVHASIFEGSIEDIHSSLPLEVPGHPAHTLKATNRALRKLLADLRGLLPQTDEVSRLALKQKTQQLLGIDSHYKIKENLFFPYMEKYGVTAPPKVMWGVDDEIRAELKEAAAQLAQGSTQALEKALTRVEDMAFKEDNILLPILVENLHEDEWRQIAQDMHEFGFFLLGTPPAFPLSARAASPVQAAKAEGVSLPTGSFTTQELAAVLNTLPLDMTFVDRDNKVRFFSQGKERAFPRTVSVLGRDVSNCHPPASVHIVEQIVSDLREGRKDHEEFWIKLGEQLVHIRYFAVRDPKGQYLGVLETTQNIAPLQLIAGEKRLLS
ncbi:MAG: DUF438 domain-containing protein [Clostridiales bacterium]|nr:DUF438 domain-containing protein [Clostridiales bacterium]